MRNPRAQSLLNRFMEYVRKQALLESGDRILCAVSGGPDSVALVRLMGMVRRRFRLTLWLAHANHKLRRRASDHDERFVRSFADDAGIPFYSKALPVRRFKKGKRLSLEEAARILRYRFLLDLANRLRADKIATAHTLDDQAETVLMRIFRGTGLKGLGAISPKRREKGIWIIRPFLGIRKAEILKFLRDQHQPFCWDETNRDPSHDRNRIRRFLMPRLKRHYDPEIEKHLLNLSDISRDVYDWVSACAQRDFRRLGRRIQEGYRLPAQKLMKIHPVVRRELYFQILDRLSGDRRLLSHKHVDLLDRLLQQAQGARIDLGRGFLAERTLSGLRLRHVPTI